MARSLRALAALAVALNVLFLSAGPWVYRDFPLESLPGKAQRDDYLLRRMPVRRVIEAVNALNYRRAPVVMLAETRGAGLESDALYTNWYNRPWTLAFLGARNRQEMASVLERYEVEYLIVDELYPIPPRQRRLVEAVTTRIGRMADLDIRRFRADAPLPVAEAARK